MKNFLLALVCCVALIGCNSDLGDYDKVKFQGKSITGWWAQVGYNGVYYDEVEDCIIFESRLKYHSYEEAAMAGIEWVLDYILL